MKSYFDGVYELFSFAEVLFVKKEESHEIKEMCKRGHSALLQTGKIQLDAVLVIFKDSLPCEDDPHQYDMAVHISENYTNGITGEATRFLNEYKEYLDNQIKINQ